MFQADYKRDLHNHYLIIQKEVQENQYSFRLKMLMNNKIQGLLNIEVRVEDNITRYFYDITSKQAISIVFEKSLLSYIQIKKVISGILKSLELGNEFLLCENDFVLEPEYIFLKLSNFEVYLCYVAEYNRDIREQFSAFIEYLMDKVDYKDDKAVLLIYGLYKISRNTDFTFNSINEIIEKEKSVMEEQSEANKTSTHLSLEEGNLKENYREMQENHKSMQENYRAMQEKGQEVYSQPKDKGVRVKENREDREEDEYSKKSIGLAVLLVLSSIVIIIVIAKTGILNNDMGNRLDYKKAIAFLIIIGAIEAYMLNIIFKKFNLSHEPLLNKDEGSNNPYNQGKSVDTSSNKSNIKDELKLEHYDKNANYNQESQGENKDNYYDKRRREDNTDDEEMSCNTKEMYVINSEETSLLKEFTFQEGYKLTSKNKESFLDIHIRDFPFVLGKLKSNVDCAIDNNKVSRIHARIEMEKERIYITDLNSTNGTYVNNDRLELNEKRELIIGDEIMLANVRYCFCKA